MARFSLGCYGVSVREAWRADEPLCLGGFSQGESLLELFLSYLEEREESHSNDVDHQTLSKVESHTLDGSCVSGIVEVGDYGFTANLIDVNRRRRSYERKTIDAELLPYYFLAYLPSEEKRGVFILQRSSRRGIRTRFLGAFEEYFRSVCPSYRIGINPFVSEKLLDEYLKGGRLTKIRFLKFGLPTDLADAYESEGFEEMTGHAEFILSPERGAGFPLMKRIRDIALGKRDIGAMYELVGEEHDNVKVEIDLGGNLRTIDLSDTMKMRSYIDISEEVRLENSGHPKFSSIDRISRDLLQELLIEIHQGNEDAG